jgi:peptide/nickel transport system substrate-binding protein
VVATAAPKSATPAITSVAVARPTTPTAGVAAKTGGMLHIGQVGDLGNLDGHFYNVPQFYTIYTAYDRLTRYDDQQRPQPMLAESWELSPDATQIKLNLRKGVQFSSGREFTSDDVKWNMLRARDPKIAVQQFANQSNWFPTIDTPDKYTVVLSSDQPRPAVFDFFELFNMLDSQAMASPAAADRVNAPVRSSWRSTRKAITSASRRTRTTGRAANPTWTASRSSFSRTLSPCQPSSRRARRT